MARTEATMRGATLCNELAILQYLHAEGCALNADICKVAAEAGELDMLRWAREQGAAWDDDLILEQAASSGDIEVAAWVKQQPGVALSASAMTAAAKDGDIAMCEYLLAEQCSFDQSACYEAAAHGHWDALRWLQEHGCAWHEYVCEIMAERGEFEVLQWARQQHGAQAWDADTILQHAASSGSVEMTAWVRQHAEVRLRSMAMRFAAAEGHTAVCEYLHSEQCPMDWSVADAGAQSGDVPTLSFLLDNGCPTFPRSLCIHAARSGSIETMQYVQQQQPGAEFTAALLTDMLNAAGACSALDACVWLRAQGAAWPLVLHDRFWKRCLAPWTGAALAWARAEGCDSPVDDE
jgi:hypothetical protein